MLGPAGKLIEIKSGINYLKSGERPIFSIHCTKTNECDVKVYTPTEGFITFPPKSFVQGAVYHIFIKKMEFEEDKAGFIGYKLVRYE